MIKMVKLYLIAPRDEGLLKGNSLALLNLGEWIRKNSNCLVEIVQDINQIKEKNAYVGISVTTPTYQKGLALARTLKQKSPNIKTIIGGYHTKGQSRFIIQHPEIDFVVEGSGERGILKILEGKSDKIIFGEQLNSEELETISVEDLLKLNLTYFQTMQQFGRINYISTRGCQNSCSFCASNGILSTKSTKQIADDLDVLAKRGFNKISIQDNYFGYNLQRIKEICNEILKRKIKIDWDCQTRVESMQDKNILKLMSDAGCSAAYLGTENFHPGILKSMNKTKKPVDYLRMTRSVIQNMLSVGIKPYLNLQVGLSYENEEIRQTNIKALEELGVIAKEYQTEIEIYPHLNVIYPGTPDFLSIVQEGIPEDIFETFTKWEEENGGGIKNLLRENHFIHGAGGIPLGILNYESLKHRKFELNNFRINEISQYMDKIKNVEGIKVFSN